MQLGFPLKLHCRRYIAHNWVGVECISNVIRNSVLSKVDEKIAHCCKWHKKVCVLLSICRMASDTNQLLRALVAVLGQSARWLEL